MLNLTSKMQSEMDGLAKKWREYIEEGTNVKPLAPATVASKIAKGSARPDTPLIDTEEMIDSIESGAEGNKGYVRISNPNRAEIAVIHEYGLGLPARPTLRPVVDSNADQIFENLFDEAINQVIEELR